ncbi:MAG: hypothetical protein WDN01_11435 [Rhizomicrobium sp.]
MTKMEDDADDARLDRLLAMVPAPAVPAALERRILDDFDRLAARGRVATALRRAADLVWPGAPVWQPAMAFAVSLMIGLGVAAFAPLGPSPDDGLFTFDAGIDIDGAPGV